MEDEASEGRPHSRRGLSQRAQRLLWAALGGGFGLLAGAESGRGGPTEVVLGLFTGAAVGGTLAPQLSHALPVFGVVIGPVVTLTLMNLQRFTTVYSVSLPPVARRATPTTDTGVPSLPYVSTAIGVIASALLAAVLLHALGRKIRGERRPLRESFRSLAWICFWITLVMILISNFAPI